jgi:hypothetical protein
MHFIYYLIMSIGFTIGNFLHVYNRRRYSCMTSGEKFETAFDRSFCDTFVILSCYIVSKFVS